MNWTLMKLAALQALAKAEAVAVKTVVTTGQKMLSQQKEDEAVADAVTIYRTLTAGVPVLNATDLDDKVVEKGAREVIHWGFGEMGGLLNRIAEPVTNAPDLPQGGPQ